MGYPRRCGKVRVAALRELRQELRGELRAHVAGM